MNSTCFAKKLRNRVTKGQSQTRSAVQHKVCCPNATELFDGNLEIRWDILRSVIWPGHAVACTTFEELLLSSCPALTEIPEIAVSLRLAPGPARSPLIRLILTESLILASLGSGRSSHRV